MLVDVDIVGSDVSLSAGVGINVKPGPVGLRLTRSCAVRPRPFGRVGGVRGVRWSREALLAHFCNALEVLMGWSMAMVLKEYRELDCLIGKDVTVMPKRKEVKDSWYEAKAVGFTEEGYLVVRRAGDGEEVRLIAEEVSVRPFDTHKDKQHHSPAQAAPPTTTTDSG